MNTASDNEPVEKCYIDSPYLVTHPNLEKVLGDKVWKDLQARATVHIKDGVTDSMTKALTIELRNAIMNHIYGGSFPKTVAQLQTLGHQLGFNITRNDGEYRVARHFPQYAKQEYKDRVEREAYYTTDMEDAFRTLLLMSREPLAQLRQEPEGVSE